MEIKDDKFVVNNSPVDSAQGAKPEPEERPATRVMDVSNRTGYGVNAIGGNPLQQQMKSSVTATRTVGEYAEAAVKTCRNCKHFDNAQWLKTLNKWKHSNDPFEQAELAMARGHLMTSNVILDSRGQMDHIDGSLSVYGLCKAYTDYFRNTLKHADGYVTWVHPDAQCPSRTRGTKANPAGTPLPVLFTAKKDSIFAKIRDALLFAGKKGSK